MSAVRRVQVDVSSLTTVLMRFGPELERRKGAWGRGVVESAGLGVSLPTHTLFASSVPDGLRLCRCSYAGFAQRQQA